MCSWFAREHGHRALCQCREDLWIGENESLVLAFCEWSHAWDQRGLLFLSCSGCPQGRRSKWTGAKNVPWIGGWSECGDTLVADLIPTLLDKFIFQWSKGAVTSCGFRGMLWCCRCVAESLGNMDPWIVSMPRRFLSCWKRKFGPGALRVIPCVGAKGFALPLEKKGCGLLGGLAVCRAGECEPWIG